VGGGRKGGRVVWVMDREKKRGGSRKEGGGRGGWDKKGVCVGVGEGGWGLEWWVWWWVGGEGFLRGVGGG